MDPARKFSSVSTHTVIVSRAMPIAVARILDRENAEPGSAERRPYKPLSSDWAITFDMLCMHCAAMPHCQILEAMIEMKSGGEWPEGGWATDPGATVTCLSYTPKAGPKVSRQQLRAMDRMPEAKLPPVCGGCAARKGSEASTSLHALRDFKASVANETLFTCHEHPGAQRPCGGWCRGVRNRRAAR